MTLIVIVCFLVINNRIGWGSGTAAGGTAAAFYDIGEPVFFFSSRLQLFLFQKIILFNIKKNYKHLFPKYTQRQCNISFDNSTAMYV
jgi:hypothetical protein